MCQAFPSPQESCVSSDGISALQQPPNRATRHPAAVICRVRVISMDPRQPVEIGRFIDIRQAEFAASVLEGSSIEAFIDQPFTGSIAPHYMLNRGGVRLFVAAESRERALDVLASIESESSDLPEEGG